MFSEHTLLCDVVLFVFKEQRATFDWLKKETVRIEKEDRKRTQRKNRFKRSRKVRKPLVAEEQAPQKFTAN